MNDDALSVWRELNAHGRSPLEILMLFIDSKQSAPWELLLALRADYERYFAAAGRMSLEEALLHAKPRKSVGNAAQRAFKRRSKGEAVFAFAVLEQRGISARRAAQYVTKKYHPIDPDSFLREMRSIKKIVRQAGLDPKKLDADS